MRILVTGATGFVGKPLLKALLAKGHQLKVLTRNATKAKAQLPNEVEVVEWHAPHGEIPSGTFGDVEVLINLMGENIGGKRWSEKQKEALRDSRIKATQKLAKAVKRDRPNGLKSVISTSAIGYYPVNTKIAIDENTPNGNGFLSTLCQDWEQSAHTILADKTIIIRVGVVLAKGGGALEKLLPIFKAGLGGPVLPGSQMMSWIHRKDLIDIYVESVSNDKYIGTINAVAPNPVSNSLFSKELAKSLSRPCVFPVPAFALKALMGEMSTIVLDSQLVVSRKLGDLGHSFTYPRLEQALQNL